MKNMNQRLFLTIALWMAVLFGYTAFFGPKRGTQPPPKAPPAAEQAGKPSVAPAVAPPAATAPVAQPSGATRQTLRSPTRTVTLETPRMRVVLTSDGAAAQSIQLLGEKFVRRKEGSKEAVPLDLVRARPGEPLPFSTSLNATDGRALVPPDAGYTLVRSDERTATFRTEQDGVTVSKTFRVDPATYRIDLSSELRSAAAVAGSFAVLAAAEAQEPSGGFFSHPDMPARSICATGDRNVERLAVGAKKPVWTAEGAQFAGLDEQYFLTAVVAPPGARASCHLEAKTLAGKEGAVISTLSVPVSLQPAVPAVLEFIGYAGPKSTDDLAAVGQPLRTAVDFGFWSVIADVLLAIMKFFHNAVPPHNWGVSIILLTVFVKLVTFPLQHKSMKSMQEMQKLQPQLEELKRKYGGDQQRQNLEMMKLYKEHGVNPMGSCLPMLIQMPVWFALYTTLQVSVELYNAPFIRGWIDDLTARDPYYVLPIAMGITMVLTQVLTPTPMSNPSQKTMGYVMSAFFSLLMLTLPSGLTLYIFTNNLLSIAQQMYLRRRLKLAPAAGQTVAVAAKRA